MFANISYSLHMFHYVFCDLMRVILYIIAAVPPSRCRVEPFDNLTVYPNITNKWITEAFIPWNPTLQV